MQKYAKSEATSLDKRKKDKNASTKITEPVKKPSSGGFFNLLSGKGQTSSPKLPPRLTETPPDLTQTAKQPAGVFESPGRKSKGVFGGRKAKDGATAAPNIVKNAPSLAAESISTVQRSFFSSTPEPTADELLTSVIV